MNVAFLLTIAIPALGRHPPQGPQPVPIIALSPATERTSTAVGSVAGLKQLPDGSILVNDVRRRRLLIFDRSLASCTLVADSASVSGMPYPQSVIGGLMEYRADSTLLIDWDSRVFLVIDPNGRISRAMAHPKSDDLVNLNYNYASSAGVDANGRFIYRAKPSPPGSTSQSVGSDNLLPPARITDTISLVRADFDKRIIDTIASVTIPHIEPRTTTAGPNGKPGFVLRVNPLPAAPDDWAVLSDGSLAIVRAHDYHIDWVLADGTAVTTARMPFDWRRVTDQDKQAKVDSARKIIDSLAATRRPYGSTTRTTSDMTGKVVVDTIIPSISFVPFAEMLDYLAPIRSGSLKADADGNLWILPTTSLQAAGGLLYDVVNRKGELFERVRLPPKRNIAGFGRGGVVYLFWQDGTNGYYIERTSIRRP